jgi:hypothetical protein
MIADKIFKFIKILFSVLCMFFGFYLHLGGFISSNSPYIIQSMPIFLILIGTCIALSLFSFDNDKEVK